MRRADLFCLPDRIEPYGNREGFPSVVADALYESHPLASSDHVEIPSALASIIGRENSDTELAEGMKRYMESSELRIGHGQRTRRTAHELFVETPHEQLELALRMIAVGEVDSWR